jgi:hypothetical protein
VPFSEFGLTGLLGFSTGFLTVLTTGLDGDELLDVLTTGLLEPQAMKKPIQHNKIIFLIIEINSL